jgi:hypothetical protein
VESSADYLRIQSISAFSEQWHPISGLDLDNPTNIPDVGVVTVKVPTNDLRVKSLHHGCHTSVTESLIQDGVYQVMIRVVDRVGALPTGFSPSSLVRRLRDRIADMQAVPIFTAVSRFRLEPLKAPRLISTFRYQALFADVSTAGYGLSWDSPLETNPVNATLRGVVVHPPGGSHKYPPRALPMPEGDAPSGLQMVRTSAVMAKYESKIVVCYYL